MKKFREEIELSYHATQRMDERMEIKDYDEQWNMAQRAYKKGKRVEECRPEVKNYILKNYRKHKNDNIEIVFFSGRLWFFSKDNGKMVTVYNMAQIKYRSKKYYEFEEIA